jgi:hypothetical protein
MTARYLIRILAHDHSTISRDVQAFHVSARLRRRKEVFWLAHGTLMEVGRVAGSVLAAGRAGDGAQHEGEAGEASAFVCVLLAGIFASQRDPLSRALPLIYMLLQTGGTR